MCCKVGSWLDSQGKRVLGCSRILHSYFRTRRVHMRNDEIHGVNWLTCSSLGLPASDSQAGLGEHDNRQLQNVNGLTQWNNESYSSFTQNSTWMNVTGWVTWSYELRVPAPNTVCGSDIAETFPLGMEMAKRGTMEDSAEHFRSQASKWHTHLGS